MNIREFYELTGGDYTDVMNRFMDEKRVRKFVSLFVKDPTYGELEMHLEAGRLREAFRSVHTLKGVCMNMGFSRLYNCAREVTEALRVEDYEKTRETMPALRQCYGEILEAIETLQKDNAL